jgi:hypothetical protein
MSNTAEVALERDIKRLQLQLDEIKGELDRKKHALSVLKGSPRPDSLRDKRFANFKGRPIEAMRILLSEAGGSMDQEELTRIMIREGAFDGKSAPENRAKLAYKINERAGNIKKSGKRIILLRDSRTSSRSLK